MHNEWEKTDECTTYKIAGVEKYKKVAKVLLSCGTGCVGEMCFFLNAAVKLMYKYYYTTRA